VHVHELDRVLDRDDVLAALAIDLVDEGCQGGRLTRAGRPGHEHETGSQLREAGNGRRKAQVLEVRRLVRDPPQRGRDVAALVKCIDAEAADAGTPEGEVDFELALERLELLFAHRAPDERQRVPGTERAHARYGAQLTVDTNHRWHSGGQVQVARAMVDRIAQHLLDRRTLTFGEKGCTTLGSVKGRRRRRGVRLWPAFAISSVGGEVLVDPARVILHSLTLNRIGPTSPRSETLSPRRAT